MRIDAHQHFLDHGRFGYPRLAAGPSLFEKDYTPEHVSSILKRNRFDGLIAVAATESTAETRWLLEVAREHEMVMGIVGWVDVNDPELPHVLDDLQRHPKFKGIQCGVFDGSSDAALREVAERDLALEAQVEASDLHRVAEVSERVPGLRIVVPHGGMPGIRDGLSDQWARDMALLAEIPRVYVKLSGLLTLADPPATASELRPYVQHLMRTFGPERLMFGSDWPFCLLAADLWKAALAVFTQALGAQAVEVRSKLLGETAEECYRLT